MAESCSLKCHVRNPKGEVVESRLFNDLLHYTSNNRELTKEYYGVGTNQEFLDKVQGEVKFDENGQITLQSLRELTDLKTHVEDKALLDMLNKDIGAGVYDYEEAMPKLQYFNRNSQFNDEFLATLEQTEDGKYRLHVVKNDRANLNALTKTISDRTLQDRILYYLNRAGVDVEFIEHDEKVGGRYSTKNAKRTADGLYRLIQVAKGEHIDADLAEEAGHFAVGALGNSPLVTRLMNLLTPEVQKKLIGSKEIEGKYLGNQSRRESAGYLVGKAIAGHIDERAPWQSLLHRIVNKIKRMFAHITGNNILRDAAEIEKITDRIASGFMSPDFSGDVQASLKANETLYSAKDSFNTKVFKTVANRLYLQAQEMANIDRSLYTKFNNIAGQVVAGRGNAQGAGILSDYIALEGITESVSLLSDLMRGEIPDLLASIDFDNAADFNTNMVRNARALRVLRTFTRNALAIINEVNSATTNIQGADRLQGDLDRVQIVDSDGQKHTYNLLEITDKLAQLLTGKEGLINQLKNKETQYFIKFCENTYGSKYVDRSARVLFDWKMKHGHSLIRFVGDEKIPLADLINDMESDIGIFDRWLGSMSNNPDVIGQIADKTTKLANKWADDLTNKAWDELRMLQEDLKNIGLNNTDIFCEVSARTGELTGNIVSRYVWGDYEADWAEFKRKCAEDFKEAHPEIENMTDFEKSILWDSYFKPLARVWHKGDGASPAHSQWSKEQQRYIPSDDYLSQQYTDNIESDPKKLQWLNKYMQLKESLDSALPEGSTNSVRMPQFKGTFMNRVRNKKLTSNTASAFGSSIRTALRETFCESSEDTDYGSDQTYNNIEEDIFQNKLAFEKEKLNRLPIYGINKLKDMSELSTDLFQSTLAYAGMANTYAAFNTIVDTLEVGSEVLNRRKVGGIYTESENRANKSRAYNRYLKFLDKQVYGISTKKIKIGRGLVINKVAGFLSGLASKVFLGGNVPGGMVNLGTGAIEVFKEGMTGEYFNRKDYAAAHGMYWGSLFSNLGSWWVDVGKQVKEDKVSLFIKHFNILGDNKEKQRNWETRRNRANYFLFNESLFLPYKTGEHYMQSIAYLGLANHIKLYDTNGKEVRMYDAYETKNLKDEYGNSYKDKTLALKGTFLKDKDSVEKYHMLGDILNQINNALGSNSPFGRVINFTQEQLDYINDKGYYMDDLATLKTLIETDKYNLTWSVDDESAFMDKAREINNRMHGIYNNQDKVAMQQSIFGNMLLSMKGYALGLAERRFGTSKHSTALGGEVEGSMRTLLKVIMSSATDRGGFSLTMRAILFPFGKKAKQDMLRAGFSANQFYNMRRNWGDGAAIVALLLLKLLTEAPVGDDDDDDNDEGETDILAGLVYYFSSRLFREQAAYNTPRGWSDESSTLLNVATPAGFSVLTQLWSIASGAVGSQFASEDDSEYFYQSSKEGVYEKGDAKWERKFWRMFPYLRSEYVFNHPYDAAASYEYGRKLRQN